MHRHNNQIPLQANGGHVSQKMIHFSLKLITKILDCPRMKDITFSSFPQTKAKLLKYI